MRLLLLAALLASPAAFADDEVWRWTDDEGALHYTNDKANIPAKFRAAATLTKGEGIGVLQTKERSALSGAVDKILSERGSAPITQDDVKPAPPAKFKNDVRQVMVFGATWCQPCSLMKKQRTLEQLVEAHPELKLKEIDADGKPELAKKYGVTHLPTVVFADAGGKEFLRVRGFQTLSHLEKALGTARGEEE